jgi:Domain of unknown function (DUF4129)
VRRSALLPAAVAIGALVAVWAATAGPVRMLGVAPVQEGTTLTGLPTPVAPDDNASTPPSARDLTRDLHPSVDLSWIGELLGYTAALAVCFGGFLLLRSLWRHRWRRPDQPATVHFEPLPPGKMAEMIEQDSEARLAAVETGGPRDGIVACWLRLEETVAACGVAPRPAETSTELVTRVLRSLDIDPRAAATLARLYREARFSDHVLTEESREQARAALRTLSQELSRPGVAT